MYDREAIDRCRRRGHRVGKRGAAGPLPELRAMLTEWQDTLAISLDTFNSIYATHADHDGCTDLIKEAISNVAQVATTTAIFMLGVSQRTHQAAHQN